MHLGFEGVIIAMLTNWLMGYLFMHNQRKLMPDEDLAHQWFAEQFTFRYAKAKVLKILGRLLLVACSRKECL